MAGNEWYYAQDNRQLGPVTMEALIEMIRQGHVQPTDLVWTESMTEWRAVSSVPALMPAAGVATGVAGGVRVSVAPSSLNYFSPVGSTVVYAGFWLRFVAAIIDGILLTVVNRILQFFAATGGASYYSLGPRIFSPALFLVAMGLMSAQIVVGWLYFALMESSEKQATLGKMALGIIVTDMEGRRIHFGKATGRFFGKYISYLTLFIGFMMAGWTQQKQALHDMLAGCLVIRKS